MCSECLRGAAYGLTSSWAMFMMAPEQQTIYQCCAPFVLSTSCEADTECMREYEAKYVCPCRSLHAGQRAAA